MGGGGRVWPAFFSSVNGCFFDSFLSKFLFRLDCEAMAQGLHLSQRMSLSQVLAPQLQQSLALLQAPTLELHALVSQALPQNPFL